MREWGNGMIILNSHCGSFPHSLLSTSKFATPLFSPSFPAYPSLEFSSEQPGIPLRNHLYVATKEAFLIYVPKMNRLPPLV
jgi:hypothetical protein